MDASPSYPFSGVVNLCSKSIVAYVTIPSHSDLCATRGRSRKTSKLWWMVLLLIRFEGEDNYVSGTVEGHLEGHQSGSVLQCRILTCIHPLIFSLSSLTAAY